jgi:succinate dehydrogenase flavin-adding protein (antitoxin of CptAB toxin-antitoxin module)
MKHIPHSILTYDRLEESQKTPQLKQIVKNIELTNDYIYEFEQKIEKEPSDKTKNNLDSLRTLLKSQEKEFFSIVMKIKKQKKMQEQEPVKKSQKQRFKELSEARGAKHMSNKEFLEMVRVWNDYNKNKQTETKPFNDIGFDSIPKYPVPERFKENNQKNKLKTWFFSFAYVTSHHIIQLLFFYFIVAVCLWEFNPGKWIPAVRYSVIIISYLATNFLLIFGDRLFNKYKL